MAQDLGLSVAAAPRKWAQEQFYLKGQWAVIALIQAVSSKALLAAGKVAHYGQGSAVMGISGAVDVDFAKVKAHVADVIAGIAPHDSIERFTSLGVTVIPEEARFQSDKEVVSDNHIVRARYFVVATGSHAFVPPITGLADVPYWTNETIFDDTEKPTHLAVIGGGPIGVEMAQAHRRLGCKVTLIEGAVIMGRDDPKLRDILREKLIAEGISIIENKGVASVAKKLTITLTYLVISKSNSTYLWLSDAGQISQG